MIRKYFKNEYNIIMNHLIQLCHILALIIYTDLSSFCTVCHQTYPKLDGETTTKQVEDGHKELYHISRCLYESIEFYGTRMERNLTVYHGLSVVLRFEPFTSYFNQPISTTAAHQFSQSKDIILALQSDTEYKTNNKRVPEYLVVSWSSPFPTKMRNYFMMLTYDSRLMTL